MKKLLETPHLFLCCYEAGDAEQLKPLLSDAKTMRFWPRPFSAQQVQDWIDKAMQCYEKYNIGRLAIVEKASGEIVGDCGVVRGVFGDEECWDLGIIMLHAFEGTGYAREASKALVEYCFMVLKLPALRANTPVNHKVVRLLAQRAGMKLIKIFNNPRNCDIETCLYELAAEDFFTRNQSSGPK